MSWNDAKESTPADARPCVVLVMGTHGHYEREFAQFSCGRWSYMGSAERLRDVEFWVALPKLPEVKP